MKGRDLIAMLFHLLDYIRRALTRVFMITFDAPLLLLAGEPNAEGIFAHSRRWENSDN